MLKNECITKHTVGTYNEDEKSFNDYRNVITDEFLTQTIFFKRKMTQGAFWTAIDKDLANQFFRDERWFCGFKFWDAYKLIDHGIDKGNLKFLPKKPGFVA
jgi:hypothetical protein